MIGIIIFLGILLITVLVQQFVISGKSRKIEDLTKEVIDLIAENLEYRRLAGLNSKRKKIQKGINDEKVVLFKTPDNKLIDHANDLFSQLPKRTDCKL